MAWAQGLDSGIHQILRPLSVDQQPSGAVVASSQRAVTPSSICYSLVGESHLASLKQFKQFKNTII